jgi:hypothetical protein
MAKGKIGGRGKGKEAANIHNCIDCGKLTEVVRVKRYNSNGKSQFVWECSECMS